jgi:hypothetical protein
MKPQARFLFVVPLRVVRRPKVRMPDCESGDSGAIPDVQPKGSTEPAHIDNSDAIKTVKRDEMGPFRHVKRNTRASKLEQWVGGRAAIALDCRSSV